ncbi:MAG: family 43 glycosylhydrolase [Ruminococcus sp.]|nr:family 43 glycosylhydrolase [Ruminococcus sp.]
MNVFKRLLSGAVLTAVAALCVANVSPSVNDEVVSLEASAAGTINNPIIWSDVPDDDIIRVGDTYYMVSTSMYFSPVAPIMKSKDLANWEICNYVCTTYANGDVQNLTNGKHDYAHGQWATCLRYNEKKGKFYAFFGSYGSNKSYICSTDDIENGEWSRVELNGMYHDASILFDDDGRNYLVSGAGGTCSIKEFNSDMTGWKSGGLEKQLFKTNFNNLAGEGWHIIKINGYYYIFGIAWPSGHGRLEFVYRSKSLTGNWESKTVLDSGLGTYGSGVAQGAIVDTPDGKWYALLFQDHGAVGRIPVLVPVNWQSDWPMMGVNGKAPLTLDLGTNKGTDVAGDDSFDYSSNDLALEWQWNHNPDNTAWSVTEREGWLRLKNKSIASHLLNARNTLTMRTEGPQCSSYIKLDTSNMKAGDYAGLSAFQLKYGCIGVHVNDDGSKKIYMSINSGSEVANSANKIVAEQNLNGNEIYLKVDFKFATVNSDGSASNNIDKANFYYSYDGQSWTKLGQELSMSYDLKLFTGYRSGIYSYATKTTGGYADIDFFEYERQTWNGCNGSKVLSSSPVIIEPDENGYYFHNTFENSSESWTGRGSASVESSSKNKYDGSKALYCSGRGASWNGATRTLGSAFKAGQEYSFSVDVMYDEGSSDSQLFYLTLQYTDASGETQYDKIAKGEGVKGEWFQLSNANYTIPAGASSLQFYVETDAGTDSFYLDEAIGGVAGTKIDGPGPAAAFILGDVTLDGRVDAFDLIAARQGLISNKFANAIAAKAADVDKSTEYEMNDLVLLNEFVLGKITKFPDNTPAAPDPPKSTFNYNAAVQYRPNDKYLNPCSQAGKITKETYNGIRGSKSLNVYTPYNYDPSKQYNIFYLMHGGGENENTIFSNDVKLQYILDNMIMNGELEPLIVVTPTFNGTGSEASNFWDEFKQSVVPFVEGKYSTYAKSTSLSDLQASRMHRAYGGFSMGGLSTWCVADHDMDIVGYFMPLSGNNWEGMNKLTGEIDSLGLSQRDYFIFAATGDKDIAYGNMKPEMEDLKTRTKYFTYTSDFSKGNLYWLVASSSDGVEKTHWWGFVRWYIMDALPYFFHEGQ